MLRRIIAMSGVTALLLVGSLALAGKPERDKKKELEPAIKTAIEEGKKACGCDFPVEVKWDSYTKADDMMRIADGVKSFTDAMVQVCESPEDKAAFCKASKGMKGVVQFGADGTFAQKDKVLTCNTNDSSYCGSHQVKAVFEKF